MGILPAILFLMACDENSSSPSKPCPEGNCGAEAVKDWCEHPTGNVFEMACAASGGESAGGICVCSGVGCNRGIICNFNTGNCADTGIHEGDPCSGSGSECHNDDEWTGHLTACNGTSYETRECQDESGNPLSCRNNKCGTCRNYANQCINQVNDKGEEIGAVLECQEGVPGKTIAMCNDVSCRADIPSCGECINGSLKCTEDNDNNAIMYRCVEGRWERIRNRLDPLDPDYACPASCREGTDPQKMEYECDRSQCDKCDPCWGEPMEGLAPANPNPCYDKARCEALLAAEDPDYPPFRWDSEKRLGDIKTQKTVKGYDFTDYSPVSEPEERVHDFQLDLTNGTGRVSCLADGSRYGVCHNSLQVCINEEYHTKGYIVQCSHGALAEYPSCSDPEDPNCQLTKGDGIACHCERLGPPGASPNANGCCYTRSSCFKNTTATSGPALCAKPVPKNEEGYGEGFSGYDDSTNP